MRHYYCSCWPFLIRISYCFEFLQAGSNGLDENLRNLLNDMMELEEALRVLTQFSLIKRVQSGQGIWIHRLIQEAIQHDLEEEDLPRWWEKVVKLCLDAFPEEMTEITRPDCRSYEEQVYIPLSKSPQIKSNTLALSCSRVGGFLWHDGKYKQAEILCEKSYNTYRAIEGERHPSTLTAMANLASTYWNQGRWDEAVTLQEKVLEARKAVLGERHPCHTDGNGQPGIDVPESGAMGRSGHAGGEGAGGQEGGARRAAP